jgi:hypothetical protein
MVKDLDDGGIGTEIQCEALIGERKTIKGEIGFRHVDFGGGDDKGVNDEY